MSLAQSVLKGDRLALARLLTEIENETSAGQNALNTLFKRAGQAHLIGVTGAPGTGKSSLVNQLTLHFRKEDPPRKVAILAVDPSSPFTGGAVLGDRIRMRDLAGDPGVFVRSMATRGSLGGLAAATAAMAQVLDAAGFEIIFIETVGAGQSEVEIAKLAHTVLVLDVPGLGDDVQAIKAGILEIADILVLNKADRPGVEAAERVLRGMLKLGHPVRSVRHHGGAMKGKVSDAELASESEWIPPIRRTVAIEGTGIAELAAAIAGHRLHLETTGGWQRRERSRLQSEVEVLLRDSLMKNWRKSVGNKSFNRTIDQLVEREISPRQAVNALLNGGVH